MGTSRLSVKTAAPAPVEMPLVEDFTRHMYSVSGIMMAQNIQDLLYSLQLCLKKTFKAIRVHFLLRCNETIESLK